MDTRLRHTVIVQLTALSPWLALSRDQRHGVITEQIEPALGRHASCQTRWLDAEAMTAQCSDVLLVETDDLRDWHHLWEEVRDTDLFAVPHFRLDSLIVATEDAYLDFESAQTPTPALA